MQRWRLCWMPRSAELRFRMLLSTRRRFRVIIVRNTFWQLESAAWSTLSRILKAWQVIYTWMQLTWTEPAAETPWSSVLLWVSHQDDTSIYSKHQVEKMGMAEWSFGAEVPLSPAFLLRT